MASLLTHALVGASLGSVAHEEQRKPPRFWWLAVFCSILPDVDVIGFPLGVRYADLWGHRGMTHSLAFAAAVALLATRATSVASKSWWRTALLFFAITASHGVLDAMTDGGLGVAFFSPFDTQRYFFPWRPLHVSPIGAGGFFSARGLRILKSEFTWVWLPVMAAAGIFLGLRAWRGWRAKAAPQQDAA
jgi:inner membrane protein